MAVQVVPGKRINDERAHEPSEDRMRRPSEDRGARTRKNRVRTDDEERAGLNAKDAERLKSYDVDDDARKRALAESHKQRRR